MTSKGRFTSIILALVGLCVLLWFVAKPVSSVHGGTFSSPLPPSLFLSPIPRSVPSPEPIPLTNDVFEIPDRIRMIESGATRDGYGPTWARTSDYMLGSVTVALILLESDGSIDPSTEDWTQGEIDLVHQRVVEGLTWWETKAQERGIALDFSLAPGHPIVIPTSYEPITRPGGPPSWGGDEDLWIDEVMEGLGYDNYPIEDYLLEVREYDNALRQAHHTDWAVTIFVVDSSNDLANDPNTPGLFSNWISSYTAVAGPRIVLVRDNDGWGFDKLGGITAHEFGHLFGAPDEEPADWSCKDNSSCMWEFGYLSVPNQNCNKSACEKPDDDCIMRSPRYVYDIHVSTICYYTEGHLGWHNSDSDDLPDPIDTDPELNIIGYPPSPSPSYALEYLAEITDIPWPTTHPNYISVTINAVSVQYQIDSTSGPWGTAIPGDGAWDSPYEENFRIVIFENGTYTIYLRAINEVGHTSAITSHTITINSPDPVYRAHLPIVTRNYGSGP